MNSNNHTLVCVPFSERKIIAHVQNLTGIINRSWHIYTEPDGTFEFPEELLKKLNWGIDDEVEWIDEPNGTFTLTKIIKNTNDQ